MYKKNKRKLAIMVVMFFITLICSNLQPISAYAEGTTSIPFETTISINGQPIKDGADITLENGSLVTFRLNFKCNPNIKPGDKLVFTLPSVFSGVKPLDYPNISFNAPIIKGNQVTLVANNNITGVVGGYIEVQGKFSSENTTGSVKVPIEINGSTVTTTIHYNPPVGVSIDKTVNGEKEYLQSTENIDKPLHYKVVVNTEKLSVPETFKDTMESGLDLDSNSIKIVNSQGQNVTSEFTNKIEIKKQSDGTIMLIPNFPIGNKYTITYDCNVNKQMAANNPRWYRTNTAEMGKANSTATVVVNSNEGEKLTPGQIGSITKKTVDGNKYPKVGSAKTYNLNINNKYYDLPVGTTITDKLPEGLELGDNLSGLNAWMNSPYGVEPGIVIYEISKDGQKKEMGSDPNPVYSITVNQQTQTIECKVLQETHNRMTIYYNATVTKQLDSITNTATTDVGGIKADSSATIKYSPPENAQITKTANDSSIAAIRHDIINRPINYQVVVNTTDMTTPKTYTDTMNSGLKLLPDTIKIVNSKGENVTQEFKSKMSIETNSKETVTTIKDFPVGGVYTITYEAMPEPGSHVKWYRNNTAKLWNAKSTATVILNSDMGENLPAGEIQNITQKSLVNGETYSNIGDVKRYQLEINSQNYQLPVGTKVVDKLPEQLTLDDADKGNIITNATGPNGLWAPGALEVYWISKTGQKEVIQNVPNVIGTLTVDAQNNTVTFEVTRASNSSYIIQFDTRVAQIAAQITNNAVTTVGDQTATNSATAYFSASAGLLRIKKEVNKTTLTDKDNQDVQYTINVMSYGAFPTSYLNVQDNINPLLKIKSVEVPNGFTYNVVGNKVSIVNTEPLIGTTENPASYNFKINTSFKDVKNGTTIDNTATVDNFPTNTVSTKKGYAFQVEKAAANNHSEMLQGAEYGVYNADNTKLYTMTSNAQGIMDGNISEPGNYYLKELKAPNGYLIDNQKIPFTISSSDIGTVVKLPEVYDKLIPKTGNLKIVKTGKDGELLQGAEFQVTGSNGFNKTVTTDSQGVANLNNLVLGTYTIKETKAPVGYTLNTTAQTVTIDANNAETLQTATVVDKELLGQIQIVKEDGTSGAKLAGAEFQVTGPNGFDQTVTTDSQGVVNLNNLAWGTYTVKETKAPIGYELNTAPQQVVVSKESVGGIQTTTFKDTRALGSLNITKVGVNGVLLQGAEFQVTGPNGFNQTITTNDKGVADLSGLAWGTYTIKETKAPVGYKINPEIKTVTIDANNAQSAQNVTVKDVQVLGSLQIIKEDATSGKVLKGAEFQVTGPNGFSQTITTNDQGVANLNDLAWGTYTIKETKAPVGYELNNTQKQIVISKESVGGTQTATFKDTRVLGSLKVTKTGSNGTLLQGASFQVTGPNGFDQTITTNDKGVANLSDLAWGTYTIKETKAPIGYSLNSKTQTVVINESDAQTVQDVAVTDGQVLGQIQIVKKDVTSDALLKGAEFQVTGPNGFNQTVTTNDKGVADLSGLAWGTYIIKETKAPVGYELNNKSQQVVVNSNSVGNVQVATFKDSRVLGSLNVTKTGSNGALLQGAEFQVTGPNGFNQTITTNDKGVADLSGLAWGTYTIKETKAPVGYTLNSEAKTIVINDDNASTVQNVAVTDGQVLGSIQIVKEDATSGKALIGAEFQITGPNGFKQEVTTNEKGEANLNNLAWGTYTIKETKAPIGYELNNKSQQIVVSKESVGNVQTSTFKDSRVLGNLTVTKTGSNGTLLQGAEFQVTGPNGFNQTITTNDKGEASLNNLAWGTYTIKETKAPVGYTLNPETKTVTINAQNTEQLQNVTITDGQVLGQIQIVKKDAISNTPLEGASFQVTGPNGFDKTVTTNEEGVASLNGLAWGTYTVKETKAPIGYELNNTPQQVVVTKDSVGKIQTTTFDDTRVLGSLNITKTGVNGTVLQGAEFQVTGSNGFDKKITTNKEGVASLNNLAWGTYTIKETKAPVGYTLNQESKTVTINAQNAKQLQSVTVTDGQVLGQIQIVKKDATSNTLLSGATFEVTGPNGFKQEVTTNEKGEANLNNLAWGTYTIKETKAPVGYELNNTPQQVVVTKDSVGKIQTTTFDDSRVLGSLNITKTGVNGTVLQGAEFRVTGPDGFNQTVTTNEKGEASLNNLAWGTYTIKETKAPIGYSLNSKVQTVTIDSNNTQTIQNIVVNDGQILGQIQIIKKDATSNTPLAGATFEVTGPNGFKQEVTTNEKGEANLNNLAWGTYTVKETKAPVGYELNNAPQQIVVTKDSVGNAQVATFKDARVLGSLTIAKTGDKGDKLQGAVFNVSGQNGYSKDITTTENGSATLNNLPWGTYTIKEIKAPVGYTLNTKIETVTIDSNDAQTMQNVSVVDGRVLGQIKIVKEDATSGTPLIGAEFQVTGENGFNQTVTTNDKGEASLNNLAWGTYTIKETKAPVGYELNTKSQQIIVSKDTVGQSQTAIFKDTRVLGSLTITKVGNEGNKLKGAVFTITGPNKYTKEIATNEKGEANLANLAWGTYTIKETKAPVGYSLNTETKTITINASNAQTTEQVTITDNRILGQIQIVKEDATSGNTLKGATFEVTGPNGYKESVTTNEKGKANLDKLAWGTYTVKETKAPVGYELNNTPQQVVVNSNTVGNVQLVIFKDARALGNLNIAKVGNEGDKLEGAVFNVTGPNGFNQKVTTNSTGMASLNNLAWGTYTIKETKAPVGYTLNSKIETVTIDANDAQKAQLVSVIDNRILGQIQIVKEDATSGNALKGAEFQVTGPNGFKQEVTTNEKGEANLDKLAWGTYTVKETKAPVGYELNNTPHQIVVSKESVGNIQTTTFKDTRVLGILNITKVGNKGDKLEGAVFTITGPKGSKEIITNKNGVANLNGLAWGTYTIKETKAPIGYTLNPEIKTVTIDAKNTQTVQHVSVVDNRILGKIQIIKEDNTSGTKLAGAKFQVTGPNGYDETVTTNKAGVAELNDLAWGTYTVKETKAPVGYELNNAPQQIVVSKDSVGNVQETTFKDNRILGSLNIIKVGNDGKKLDGAEFTIAGPNGYSKNVTTHSNGVARLNDLPWGVYTIKEIKAPNGYELNKQVFTVNINAENARQQQQITIKDNLIPITNNKENNNKNTGSKGNSGNNANSGNNTNSGDSPQTGDSSELPIYALLALALVGLGINARRKNKDKKIAK